MVYARSVDSFFDIKNDFTARVSVPNPYVLKCSRLK